MSTENQSTQEGEWINNGRFKYRLVEVTEENKDQVLRADDIIAMLDSVIERGEDSEKGINRHFENG